MIADLPYSATSIESVLLCNDYENNTELYKNLAFFELEKQALVRAAISTTNQYNSTREFIDLDQIDTSLQSIKNGKSFINIEDENQKINIEVKSFTTKLNELYKINSDKAVIYIFDVIDDWNVREDEVKFNKLFNKLIDQEFNEDIYISILSSTILLKENIFRKQYFKFVVEQLFKDYNSKEVDTILRGL